MARIAICGLGLCLLSACIGTTPHQQIRTLAVADPLGKGSLGDYNDLKHLPHNVFTKKVGERIVESYQQFDLSVVEFDDQGKLWNKDQQLGALDGLVEDTDAKKNGAIILVFVHGWQENADVVNATVRCFRRMLYTWYQDEGPDGRRIIGVYVGWRGQSQRLPLLKYLTFWTRKKAAHKIGRGDMDELLVHLGDLKRRLMTFEPPEKRYGTRLVIIGHSFGGAIVFSALDNILKKNTLESIVPFQHGESNEVGVISAGDTDLVVLLNPAFETLLYSGLAEATTNCTKFNLYQNTVLMTIGAENDSATGVDFPVGQFFPTLLQNFKTNSDERMMNKTALGHYTRYFNYQLTGIGHTNSTTATASDKQDSDIDISQRHRDQLPSLSEGLLAQLSVFTNRQWNLFPYPGNLPPRERAPFLVISATPDIVDNHTGIWGDALVDFLRDFIAAHDDRQAEIKRQQTLPSSSK